MSELRDYQQTAVDQIRDAFRRGVKNVLFQGPTGMGKTVLFSYIAKSAAAMGKRVCIIVHRHELLTQTVAKLGRVETGVICNGYTPYATRQIQVASIQSLVNRMHRYDNFDLMIFDEAHHAVSNQWRKVVDNYTSAKILGVTATPMRADGRGLGEIFHELIPGPDVSWLTERGYLSPVEAYAPSTIDVSGVHTSHGDYQRAELAVACDTPTITGDAIKHYRTHADGLPVIAFCVSVKHAQHVAEQFRAAGYMARKIDGANSDTERKGMLAGLAHGDIDVLTSCDLISEGVDVPVVSCGIMLRPTKSLGLALQQMGRVLRPAPNKDKAIILDHAGLCLRHGLPDTPREWSLEGAEKCEKADAAKRALKRCPECFALHPARPSCPSCGHVYQVEGRDVDQRDGDLVKITGPIILPPKKKVDEEVRKARSEDELRKIAESRGYKQGWVDHILRSRQARAANG